jgi:hypothetical protein
MKYNINNALSVDYTKYNKKGSLFFYCISSYMENCQSLITTYLACMSSTNTQTITKEKCKTQYEQAQACIQITNNTQTNEKE